MEIDFVQTALALCVGISLSAACGFRVFIPLLVMSISMRLGWFTPAENLAWVGSDTAFYCLCAATLAEVIAYYIPLIDNILDTITTPAALIAGAIITAGMLGDLPDWLQWSAGIIAGAGAAGTVQLGTASVRATGTATTAGISTPIISTIENLMATVGSLLAVILPILAVVGAVLFIALGFFTIRKIRDFIARRAGTPRTAH